MASVEPVNPSREIALLSISKQVENNGRKSAVQNECNGFKRDSEHHEKEFAELQSQNNGLLDRKTSFNEKLPADVDVKLPSVQKEPLLLAKLVARRPYWAFGITLGLQLLMIAVTAILYVTGYEILPVNFDSLPIFLRNTDVFTHQEAWINRDADAALYDRSTGGEVITERSVKYDRLTMQFMYEKEGGNVFTKDCLSAIQKFEDELYNDPDYQSKYCLLDGDNQCQKLGSIIRFFDGTLTFLHPYFNDTNFENIPRVLALAESHPLTKRQFQYFLGKDSVINNTRNIAKSSITRSLLFYGYPLAGFDTLRDESKVQYNKVGDYITATYGDKWRTLAKDGISGMKFMYMNFVMYWYQINSQVNYDMIYIIFSFSFIFLFVWFQTGSLWLSLWGMASIIFSFVTGNLIYNIILDFKYFGILHVLSLFILLGVGADDVFIFCDTWKHSDHGVKGDLVQRLSECYRRAGGTMFVTSVTTAAAFFINSFSPILAMSSFGTFSGVTVIVNYLSIIIFFPTTVLIWHLKWENKGCCKKNSGPASTAKLSCNIRLQAVIIRFLTGRYFRFLMNKFVRCVVLLGFTGLVVTSIYFSSTLVPDDQQPRAMKKSHNIEQFLDKNVNSFRPSGEDNVIKLYIVWGIKSQDVSMCHPRKFDEQCTGNTVWDNSFDLNPPPAQIAMLKFCQNLRGASDEMTSKLGIRRDIITDVPQVRCFIENMDRFFEFQRETHVNTSKKFLPTTEIKMRAFMEDHSSIYNMTDVQDNFYRYFETAYAYWISNKHRGYLSWEDKIYQSYLGESYDKRDTNDILGFPGMKYGTRLRYAVVAVNLTFQVSGTDFKDGISYYNSWESFLQNQTKDMPPSVNQPFQATSFAWQWFHIQRVLEKQGVLSVVVGVAVAWVILVLTSGNIIVGTMATMTIASVTVCVIGLIPLVGWKLGVLEALNMSLVVGLSVDYSVHLGVAYTYAPCADRQGRVKHALSEIGLSVISGAVTTLGSGLFMMFAEIVFFMQFGIFIFATIGFSILFSVTFFLVLLSTVGPQGSTGATAQLTRAIQYKMIGRKETDVDCDQCKGRGFHSRFPITTSNCRNVEETTWL